VGIEAQAVATVADAVADTDVVITATNAPEPVLLAEHVSPGQHIGAIGIRTEIAPDAIGLCRVIGDGREETLRDGKFSTALVAGAVAEEDLGPELGAVLEGLAPGRSDDTEITLFDSSGVAIQDVVCAAFAWKRAVATDTGTEIEFADAGVLD
jgi:ornithine cyclodeaminase/alanine dehydrogenase-like protein (mu-crystallin family)